MTPDQILKHLYNLHGDAQQLHRLAKREHNRARTHYQHGRQHAYEGLITLLETAQAQTPTQPPLIDKYRTCPILAD